LDQSLLGSGNDLRILTLKNKEILYQLSVLKRDAKNLFKNEKCKRESANANEKSGHFEIYILTFAFCPAEAGKFIQFLKRLNGFEISCDGGR